MKRTTKPGEKQRLPKGKVDERYKLFVAEYLTNFNATKAAIAAGYAPKAAHVTGCLLLKNDKVQRLIQEAMNDRAERTKVTQDRVVKELAKIAFANMKDFVRWGPTGVKVKNSQEVIEEDSAAIAEISQVDTQYGTNIKFKLHDKLRALELLGKHLGMFLETVINRHTGESGGPVEISHEFSDSKIKAAFDILYNGKGV
jgi:phage terminase small subunit